MSTKTTYTCDMCKKTTGEDTHGWYHVANERLWQLTHDNIFDRFTESSYGNYHLCSVECLIAYLTNNQKAIGIPWTITKIG